MTITQAIDRANERGEREKLLFFYVALFVRPPDPQDEPNKGWSVSTMCVAKRHIDEAGADEEGEIPRRR
jgi:hypothetical protein